MTALLKIIFVVWQGEGPVFSANAFVKKQSPPAHAAVEHGLAAHDAVEHVVAAHDALEHGVAAADA